MYAKLLITGLMIAAGALIGTQLPPGIANENEDLTKLYESCIVNKIERYESLADILYTSDSVTLRDYARLQSHKAQFLDAEKDMLIDIMIQTQLEPKRYKIEHFLEEQYYRSLEK